MSGGAPHEPRRMTPEEFRERAERASECERSHFVTGSRAGLDGGGPRSRSARCEDGHAGAEKSHAIAQVNAWLDAGVRSVRLNPDVHYRRSGCGTCGRPGDLCSSPMSIASICLCFSGPPGSDPVFGADRLPHPLQIAQEHNRHVVDLVRTSRQVTTSART
jgi:hypothetical protein